jgi:hypothetical protein
MVRKSPDKQWNRQNSILFHEAIPLRMKVLQNTVYIVLYMLCHEIKTFGSLATNLALAKSNKTVFDCFLQN